MMDKKKRILLTALGLIFLITGYAESDSNLKIDSGNKTGTLNDADKKVVDFILPLVSGKPADHLNMTQIDNGWYRIQLSWVLSQPVQQDELAIEFTPAIRPDFWWAPHLSPNDGDCIAQHVFRSPAIIASENRRTLVIVPDLEFCGKESATPWFMDYDVRKNKIWLGLSKTERWAHVGYKKIPGMMIPAGKMTLGFYITTYEDKNPVRNPWSKVTHFLWDTYAKPLYRQGQPTTVPLDHYVKHTYHWAFDSWKDAVWQEFDINGKRVGAPQFIVNYSQSPNYTGHWFQREYLSIWNQAWFSSLRSASGLARYAQRNNDAALLKKAMMTKELALSAPFKEGVFCSVIRTDNTEVEIEGKKINRPKDWTHRYWTNSNRCPRNYGITEKWYHLLDAGWTSLLMLRWYEDIEKDSNLIHFATRYADFLLTLQDEQGYFPGWLNPETLEPANVMSQSPETSMSVTFLLKLSAITNDEKYSRAALKALEAVIQDIIPIGRWEDFETYWSCNPYGSKEYLGKKIPRNGIFKQCNFSMYWTAEALLEAYRKTKEKRYLQWGRRTLDELSMTQQVWQPPFIYVPALGGFGVMNFDGEWNDSRQSLFAELFMDYYQETGDKDLFERGICALKAGFIMMYCPENPEMKKFWEKKYPFFGPDDYGFTMENYGHGGATDRKGRGVGSFTIYDWGNGAASEARNRIYDHYGDVYVDRNRKDAFGIDSIFVDTDANSKKIVLKDMADSPRKIKVVFEDGSSKMIWLENKSELDF